MALRLSSWMFVKTAGEILNRPGDPQDVIGLLLSPLGDAWYARSGPYDNGAAPNGSYRIEKWQPKPATKGPVSFTDRAGHTWLVPITPLFQTKRGDLAIHPDGSKQGFPDGTQGCIGVQVKDTSQVSTLLRMSAGQVLQVRYWRDSDQQLLSEAKFHDDR